MFCAFCRVALDDATYLRACGVALIAACTWQAFLFAMGHPVERAAREIFMNAACFVTFGYGAAKAIQGRRDPARPVLREVETTLSDRFVRFPLLAIVGFLLLNPGAMPGAWMLAVRHAAMAGWDLPGIAQGLRAVRSPVDVFAPLAVFVVLVRRQGARFFDPRVANSSLRADDAPVPARDSVFVLSHAYDEAFDRLGARLVEYGFEVRGDRSSGRLATNPLRCGDELCIAPDGSGADWPRYVRLDLELRATADPRRTRLSIRPDFVVVPDEAASGPPAPCRSRGVLEASIYAGTK